MLSGFNTNIRHRGVLFHVQSEDSGRDHPHIITHLYYGGTILASEKSSYADQVDAPDLPQVVRALMERQHKAVLRRLRSRAFDDLIAERLGADIFSDAGDTKSRTHPTHPTQPTQPTRAAPAATAPPPRKAPPPPATADQTVREAVHPFGEGIVSEKPLDEVILNYLVENARKRKRTSSS
jgi:hypothetical protein